MVGELVYTIYRTGIPLTKNTWLQMVCSCLWNSGNSARAENCYHNIHLTGSYLVYCYACYTTDKTMNIYFEFI